MTQVVLRVEDTVTGLGVYHAGLYVSGISDERAHPDPHGDLGSSERWKHKGLFGFETVAQFNAWFGLGLRLALKRGYDKRPVIRLYATEKIVAASACQCVFVPSEKLAVLPIEVSLYYLQTVFDNFERTLQCHETREASKPCQENILPGMIGIILADPVLIE